MLIENSGNYISNKSIEEIINLLGEEYKPQRIIIYEKRNESFIHGIKNAFKVSEMNPKSIALTQNGQTVAYYILSDTIKVFLYDKDNNEVEQVELIYDLLIELRRRYYYMKDIVKKYNEISQNNKRIDLSAIANDYITLYDEPYMNLINRETISFSNLYAKEISKIMEWKDEWTYDEN